MGEDCSGDFFFSFFTVVLTERVLKSKYYVNSLMRSEHKACTPSLRYFCVKINNIANNMMSLKGHKVCSDKEMFADDYYQNQKM